MQPVATDITRSVVCVLGTRVSYAKMAKPINMPIGEQTHVDPRNRVLDGGSGSPM